MNWDRFEGSFKQIRGKLRQCWGELTDDQRKIVAGKRDRQRGLLQESYGIAMDEADRQFKEWEKANEHMFGAATNHGEELKRRIAS